MQGIGELVVYGRAADQLAQLEALNARLSDQEMRLAWLDGAQVALMVALTNGAALAVLALAIPRVEPIWLATLALGTVAAFEALMPLSQAAAQMGANVAAAKRLFEVVDATPAVSDPIEPADAPQGCDLRFDNITFRYPVKTAPALDGVSLEIPQGMKIAIVGASGSGKSTLVNLLARFWEVESGRILLDGRDVRDYRQADVRHVIGVMEQRTHLFNTTIRENIWIGQREADESAVIAAAKAAQIHEFIMGLPEGYATRVGENGVRLSGGERQRIALARVLLKDAPIVVLDEPTANLDTINERAILETILQQAAGVMHSPGKTLILLTHRRVLLDQMDAVVVMEKGQLLRVES